MVKSQIFKTPMSMLNTNLIVYVVNDIAGIILKYKVTYLLINTRQLADILQVILSSLLTRLGDQLLSFIGISPTE